MNLKKKNHKNQENEKKQTDEEKNAEKDQKEEQNEEDQEKKGKKPFNFKESFSQFLRNQKLEIWGYDLRNFHMGPKHYLILFILGSLCGNLIYEHFNPTNYIQFTVKNFYL